jgi:SAM-dependent methyltransferase
MMTDTSIATYRTTCRASGGPLVDLLDLGPMHLSGFIRPGDPEPPSVPLTLAVNETSGLVQLRHTVDPDRMFRTYWYRSGINEQMRNHLAGIVADIRHRVELKRGDGVLDIGCNDGTMLREYPEGILTVGVDPSNANPTGISLWVQDYFSARLFAPRSFKVVTSIACLYDMDDPVAFASDVATVMRPDGLWVTEQHYLPAMLETNGFDAICHEHLLYLSLYSLEYIVSQVGLVVVDVTTNNSNGGSFRAYIARQGEPSERVLAMREAEKTTLNFDRFRQNINLNKGRTIGMLRAANVTGKTVAGLGASTKFNTILQAYGIGPELLPWISERMPDKWGLVTAGTGIPIISEAESERLQPDYYLVGPYHLIDALVAREQAFVQRGGRFIVPMPEPHLVPEPAVAEEAA